MEKILVIRGGALGDFILSLPVLAALKKEIPGAEMEILGYPRIAQIAQGHYAVNVRSVDHGSLARFFGEGTELPDDWCRYFAGFDQIISFFYDPDDIFQSNLRRAGARHILSLPHKPDESKPVHAAEQFARGLEKIGMIPEDFTPRIYPDDDARTEARKILAKTQEPLVAIHPGSGSPAKNWPLPRWSKLLEWLLSQTPARVTIVLGEAERENPAAQFARYAGHPRVKTLQDLPLPVLAGALQETTVFIGHDSGVSHLAAAVGTPVVALFGPTNPLLWQPVGATVIKKGESLDEILLGDVQFALAKALGMS